MDRDPLVAAELLEIGDGKEADVGRVVPVAAQQRAGPRGAALLGKLLPQLADSRSWES